MIELIEKLNNLIDVVNLREALDDDEDDIQTSCFRGLAFMALGMAKTIDKMKQAQYEAHKLTTGALVSLLCE